MKTTSAPKTGESKSGPKDVDKYLADVPEPARSTLKQLRASIRRIAPKETTETISYRMPMFKYKGMLLGYAAFAKHCSLFPGGGVIVDLKSDLANFSTSKGAIRFAPDKPFPAALLKKLVKARVARNDRKKHH